MSWWSWPTPGCEPGAPTASESPTTATAGWTAPPVLACWKRPSPGWPPCSGRFWTSCWHRSRSTRRRTDSFRPVRHHRCGRAPRRVSGGQHGPGTLFRRGRRRADLGRAPVGRVPGTGRPPAGRVDHPCIAGVGAPGHAGRPRPVPRISGCGAPWPLPHLPQGAPSSPHLANLVAFSLDRRLDAYARAAGFPIHPLCRRPDLLRGRWPPPARVRADQRGADHGRAGRFPGEPGQDQAAA